MAAHPTLLAWIQARLKLGRRSVWSLTMSMKNAFDVEAMECEQYIREFVRTGRIILEIDSGTEWVRLPNGGYPAA